MYVYLLRLTTPLHLLLTILSGFTYKIMTLGFVYFLVALFPLAFIIAFSFLELAIALIQAIVFVILACTYIKDGLELHDDAFLKLVRGNSNIKNTTFNKINGKRYYSTINHDNNSSTPSSFTSIPLVFSNADTNRLEILKAGKNKSSAFA